MDHGLENLARVRESNSGTSAPLKGRLARRKVLLLIKIPAISRSYYF